MCCKWHFTQDQELFSMRLWSQNHFRNCSIVSLLLQNGTGGVHNQKVLPVRHANSVSLEQGCCDPARSTAIEWKQNPAWNVGLDRCLSRLSDHITEPMCTRQLDAHSITLQSHFSLPTNVGQIHPSASKVGMIRPLIGSGLALQRWRGCIHEPANMLIWQHGLVVLFSTAQLSVVNDVNI